MSITATKLIVKNPHDKDGVFKLIDEAGNNVFDNLLVKKVSFDLEFMEPLTIHLEVYVDEIDIEGNMDVVQENFESTRKKYRK